MADAFFLPLRSAVAGEDRWQATVHTTGPWQADAQHGGPPSALLARAIERTAEREEMVLARITIEILGPVPVGELSVTSRVRRPGRRVELVEASMSAAGRECARATAWRVQRAPVPLDPVPAGTAGTVGTAGALPEAEAAWAQPGWVDGYLSAIEWRTAAGSVSKHGPAAVWTRLRYPLVAGEAPSGLQRVMAVADSGNGVSNELDLRRWLFINPELTVHLHREAVGEWVCLDARTVISPGAAGLATSVLSDRQGLVGVGAQSLLVAPR